MYECMSGNVVVSLTEQAAERCIYIYIYTSIEDAFGGLLCYGAPSTAFRRKRSDASVLSKALLMSAMLMTETWATEVRSCPWPQCDSASG